MKGAADPFVICVTGAESTGKSTLAAHLAASLDAPLVPEVARGYLERRSDPRPGASATHGYGPEDVEAIARAQLEAEIAALATAPLVVADTDLTVIQVWWEEKFGPAPAWLQRALAARSPRCYLLPRPDIPWEYDPLRESPLDRQRLHQRYLSLLDASAFDYVEVYGRGPDRQARAERWVRQRLAARAVGGL